MFFVRNFLVGSCGIVLTVGLAFGLSGCRKEEPECIPSGKKKVIEVESTPLPQAMLNEARAKLDQCHACVLSKRGFYSCQTVWAERNETRDMLKTAARKKACEDAGFVDEECPDKAVKLLQCKGDRPVEETELSKSLRRMMMRAAKQNIANAGASKPLRIDVPSKDAQDAQTSGAQATAKPSDEKSTKSKIVPEVE